MSALAYRITGVSLSPGFERVAATEEYVLGHFETGVLLRVAHLSITFPLQSLLLEHPFSPYFARPNEIVHLLRILLTLSLSGVLRISTG